MGDLGGEHGIAEDAEPTRELLERALGRDLEAERALFERFRPALLGEARASSVVKRLGAAASADDILQEVWRRALAAGLLARFEDRGRGSLERTLKRVLEYTLADLARRLGAEKRGGLVQQYSLDFELPRGERLADAATPATTPTAAARCGELVSLCRAELDEREWRVWCAVELEGRSAAEVGASLATSAAAVRGILFRSRAKLVAALSGWRTERGGR